MQAVSGEVLYQRIAKRLSDRHSEGRRALLVVRIGMRVFVVECEQVIGQVGHRRCCEGRWAIALQTARELLSMAFGAGGDARSKEGYSQGRS